MKRVVIALALGCSSLTGCAQFAAMTAQNLSSATPQQATTLGEAIQFATLATQGADVYVNAPGRTAAQVQQIERLNEAVHSALTDLEAANAAGKSLVFSSFNAALAAFNSYKGTQ